MEFGFEMGRHGSKWVRIKRNESPMAQDLKLFPTPPMISVLVMQSMVQTYESLDFLLIAITIIAYIRQVLHGQIC